MRSGTQNRSSRKGRGTKVKGHRTGTQGRGERSDGRGQEFDGRIRREGKEAGAGGRIRDRGRRQTRERRGTAKRTEDRVQGRGQKSEETGQEQEQ